MSRKKGGFSELFYSTIMPKIYGIGAAVVIVGAMFKILHLPGADPMLVVGLTTEAIIFFFSAFEPKHFEPDWSKVYPELGEDYDGPAPNRATQGSGNGSVTKKLDHMLESSKIGPELIDSLGKGMRNIADSAQKMSNLSSAAVATDEYAKNVQNASRSLIDMNKSYASTVSAMSEMTSASKDAKEYHSQVQSVTKNLSALNAVYEMELQDANSHLKAMNKFYSNVSAAMESMAEASRETEKFKNEMSSLTTNLTSLNTVYGNMLTAMKG
ncbi:gliding motility protein GldL [Fulvivirgaceae bacterium BMA10]|uniref:Gliding motility protein GldL n=1 Tax=Splendidivirga corallicola TaxID=3051826 RepID=A0ABT8KTD3_9BACT|nr:gliding motility protein GldL [Fulvivirgaceae bacterium BMA10]